MRFTREYSHFLIIGQLAPILITIELNRLFRTYNLLCYALMLAVILYMV